MLSPNPSIAWPQVLGWLVPKRRRLLKRDPKRRVHPAPSARGSRDGASTCGRLKALSEDSHGK
eukprot:scaffold11187_cov30-Tisochrysis_lutea.AAC.8